MNTLLIAPDSNLLKIPEETRHIQEALSAQVINGRVTPAIIADAISNRIARRQKIDLLFFIGHGSLTGLQLTDGQIPIADLCRYVKSANISTVVLNTCESEFIALAIHHETNATVICTLAQVDDNQAYATSRLLAEAIGQGHSIEEAYNLAKPSGAGVQTYRMFSGKTPEAAPEEDVNSISTIKMIYALFSRLEQQLNDLRRELMREIEAVRHDMKPLEHRIYSINERTVLPITISVGAAVTAFIVLIWSILEGK